MPDRRAALAPLPTSDERVALLDARRGLKMARSAHAFVRGSTALFYGWLADVDHGAVPQGPPVWVCGDCHVGNLGPLANADGKVRVQVRDLDQTVHGNPAHDLLRLGLSLSAAARGSNLPGLTTARMLEQVVHGYRDALAGHRDALSEARAGKAVRALVEQATRRRWEHLAQERLDRVEPRLPLGKRFWPLSAEERAAVEALVGARETQTLVHALHGRGSDREARVVDAAYWIKGCSSLGTLRCAVLVAVGTGRDRVYRLVDVKEAVASVAPSASDAFARLGHADRVVSGARAIAPYLGERMLAARLLGRPVVLRELMPQDLKLELDQITAEEAVKAARFLAAVVGHAHARQMPDDVRAAWARELARHHSSTLDAPSWLWTTVVDLVGHHERAYLDHCRSVALAA